MVRLLMLAAALFLTVTAPALADPTALSYTFDWTITSRYAEFNFGPPLVFTSSQAATVTGHGPISVTPFSGGLQFPWADSKTSGTAIFPFVSSPTDSFVYSTGIDGAPMARGALPRNLGFYDPVGDPLAPDSFTLSFGSGTDCSRFFVQSGGACNFQFESMFSGSAQRASVGAPEPTTLAIMGIGLIFAGSLRRRRR